MNINKFSPDDIKNAINRSKRGQRFCLITNILISVIVGVVFVALSQSTSNANLQPSQFIPAYIMAVCVGLGAGLVMYIGDENILKISWFKVKPTDKELDNYYEWRKKHSKEQVGVIERQISDLSMEKQKHEANLA